MNHRRLLARTLVYDGKVRPLTLLTDLGNGQWLIEPFTHATANTSFENQPLALIPANDPMPVAATIDELIELSRSSKHIEPGTKLRLITLNPSGCQEYPT